ncbi:MAG: maleylpyruvate isomerase N-terminal domain-containing protein [Micromonosporaceae bacterium]|nr:maleylpyruvate isomerase N-terminal domain-containing protein [Micromonosporaceae bacterium]
MSEDAIGALRASHDRLAAIVAGLTPEQETAPAYPSEWSIAQVLSHIGSGAEIMALAFDAALAGTPVPGREAYPAIWDRWNAKAPRDQVRDGIESDRQLVARFEALDADQRSRLRFASFVGEVDADRLARLRLNEHAVHTWDVAVALDPTATIGAEAVGLVVDSLARVAGFSGRADGLSGVVQVTTTDPEREFTLTFGPTVSLEPGRAEAATAELALPAEAFIRLVYGRLDPAHTPPVTATGIALDDLRRAFPGF